MAPLGACAAKEEFPLIKLAKKLKVLKTAIWAGVLKSFPLIKLAKKLKDYLRAVPNKLYR